MNKYSAYFAIESQLKNAGFDGNRSDLITQFTDGKKSSLTQLEHIEYTEFLKWLRATFQTGHQSADWQKSPQNKMRQKLWRILCHEMRYTEAQMHQWVEKYGRFHKPLKQHNHQELTQLVSQAEIVLQGYYKDLHNESN